MGGSHSKSTVVHKQKFTTVTLIQLGFFLSATLATIIGGAWTNVLQSNFLSSVSDRPSTGIPTHLASTLLQEADAPNSNTNWQPSSSQQPLRQAAKTTSTLTFLNAFLEHEQKLKANYTATVIDAKKANFRYAMIVTLVGILIMVAWTLFLQEINPSLVSSIEPTGASNSMGFGN